MRSGIVCRGTRRLLIAGVAAIALVAGQARAADNLIPGKITLIKPGSIAKGIFKPTTPAVFPIDGDPTTSLVNPPSLQVFDTTAPGAGFVEYDLVAANWQALGNPAGSKGYKYKGAGTPADPCKIVLVKEKVIKFICKGSGVTLAPPTAGSLGAVLTTQPGSRYCGLFGGTSVKNDPTQTKRKDAPAPGECPAVPGPAVCGDGVQQVGEQCDDSNPNPGDGCSESCEIEAAACDGGVIGKRQVTVSLDVPAGEDLATARVTITYPDVLTGIPGVGDSSFVQARISGTPAGGNILVNDQESDLTVAYIGLPPSVIPNGMTTQFVLAEFDSCVDISRDFCSRNQQVIDCCNDVGGDPMQAGCPLNPPVCPAGQFPLPGANPAPCVTVAGSCPSNDFCLDQLENTVCNVSDTNDANGLPIPGVTCTISVDETIVGPTTTTSTSSTSTSSTTSTTTL
jgi:cysteine-rich repeat protein